MAIVISKVLAAANLLPADTSGVDATSGVMVKRARLAWSPSM